MVVRPTNPFGEVRVGEPRHHCGDRQHRATCDTASTRVHSVAQPVTVIVMRSMFPTRIDVSVGSDAGRPVGLLRLASPTGGEIDVVLTPAQMGELVAKTDAVRSDLAVACV